MSNIESVFNNYCSISQRVQFFEEKLKTADVSSEMRPELHHELETIHGELDALRQVASKTTVTFSEQLTKMDQQIVSLFGQIEEYFENYEVNCIAKEALDLGTLIEKGQMVKVAALVDRLKGHIEDLFKEHLPSLQNRKIIQFAQKMAEQATFSQEGGKAKLYSLHLIAMLKTLIQEAALRTKELLLPEEAELAMELYEIADLYSHHYLDEARHRLKTLTHSLPQASKCLKGDLSDEECANYLIELAQDITLAMPEPELLRAEPQA